MQSTSGFLGTAPSPLTASKASSDASVAPEPDKSDCLLAGIIGAELSGPLATAQHIVQNFTKTQKISRAQLRLLHDTIDLARRVAMQSQQIARLAGGRLRQSHERLSLDAILNQALDEHTADFQQHGKELYRSIKPVEIIVDPGLLSSLVDAAIVWAASRGQRLVVSLDIKNWPEHGLLLIKASQTVATGERPDAIGGEEESLSWHLLSQTARAMGVTLDRVASPDETMLMIEFPRTVKQLEGLTAVEMDVDGDSAMHSESKPLAGHRILLVSTDETLRTNIRQICRSMGLVMDSVPSSLQAVRFCELDKPHLIIIDERLHDRDLDELRKDLHKTDPNFPFLEIAIQSNTFEMASWMSNSMTRISRDSLRAQLPSILVLELAKVA
ncbi:hypothetical protein [Variovorax terrae]|uniref:Response regulatory domain-containing protein n=1 Tax=Variovorax terrae TaxID=2923278 RepID=A0A9X1VWC0_9BURK|nr:hypothetical protein [Variovorax terrae]MCJ0764592.1 hypothetical protein [Variovorax terrae]